MEDPRPPTGTTATITRASRPFLNPYLLRDQSKVKGNVIIIAGGGSNPTATTWWRATPVSSFNKNGYNAFVLQRRVRPTPL